MNKLLEVAEKQLDRTHAFFPRIDGKFVGLLALVCGQVAILTLNLRPDDLGLWYISFFSGLFATMVLAAAVHLFLCAKPHLKGGGGSSLYYFGTIAKRTEGEYIKDFRQISDEDRIDDALAQVWRNSEIVAAKFNHLKWATIFIVLAAAPWSAALLSLGLIHHAIPSLKAS